MAPLASCARLATPAYEVVAGLRGWTVVSPKRDRSTPLSDVFEVLLAGRRVVLLLEDLNDYAEAALDLGTFCGPDGLGHTASWTIAATCRDGPELGVVREALNRRTAQAGRHPAPTPRANS